MQLIPMMTEESARMSALRDADILDTPEEPEFDLVAALAAELCSTPIALVTLIDAERQWFKAHEGIATRETPLELSICVHVVQTRNKIVLNDAALDPRFADHPLVVGAPHIRFYAGIPVCTADGIAIGTLCVMDHEPRELSEREERVLIVLAKHVASLIDLRIARNNAFRLLQELRERSRTHERITHTATRLLTVVAHDVRGPLDSMISALEYEDMALAPLRAEIKSQAIFARDLLDQILAWARTMMRGGPTVEFNVDMQHIVNEVIEGSAAAAARKGTTIHSDVQVSSCDTDPNLMRFILHTLVTNAVKFTENGRVEIRLNKRTDNGTGSLDRPARGTRQATMEVIDTGTGMTPETLQQLFDWGRRSSKSGTRHERGAGLALLLVKDFCDLLGWSIRVESEVGKGTRVVVACAELPIFVTS